MFQWYVFVLIAVVAVFARLMKQIEVINCYKQKEERYGKLPVLAIGIPLIYLAGIRDNLEFGDTLSYRKWFLGLSSDLLSIPSVITGEGKDKGFSVFTIIMKSIIGSRDVWFFTIIAMISIGCLLWVYKKYSSAFAISMFLFIASTDYLQWNYNGIRQFMAVSICFACIDLIVQKKYTKAIIIILLASTIHATALLMIPILFIVQGKPWNLKTVLFILGVILAISYVEQFTDLLAGIMESTQYSNEVDQFTSDNGAHMFRAVVYGIPAVIALVFRKRLEFYNNPVMNVCTNMSIIALGFYVLAVFTSGIFIGRIPIYFSLYNYILLPWEINTIFTKKSAKVIYAIMIVFYLIYYYYQAVISWGL